MNVVDMVLVEDISNTAHTYNPCIRSTFDLRLNFVFLYNTKKPLHSVTSGARARTAPITSLSAVSFN